MAELKEAKLDFTLKELTLSRPAEHEDIPGGSSTVELRDKKLVCVEYPGVFSSVDRMLNTLGGEQSVAKVSGLQLGQLPVSGFNFERFFRQL